MLPFISNEKKLVGLDLGTTAIRAIQLRPVGNGWRIHRWGRQPLPPDSIAEGKIKNSDQVVTALRALFETQDFSTDRVALAVGGPSVIIKTIQLPFMTELALEDQISLEAEEHIPFGLDDVHLDFQILNREQDKMNVLLTACKSELMKERLSVVERAGLTPVVCDLELCALLNAHQTFITPEEGVPEPKDKTGGRRWSPRTWPPWQKKKPAVDKDEKTMPVRCLANTGGAFLNVAMTIGGLPMFTRDHVFGTHALIQQIGQELEIPADRVGLLLSGGGDPTQQAAVSEPLASYEDQLMGTLRQSIDFFNKSHPHQSVTELCLSGTVAVVPGLVQRVAEGLGLTGRIGDPMDRLKPGGSGPPWSRTEATRSLLALGLALRGEES